MIKIASDNDAEQIKLYMLYITKFLKNYKWLIDSFVLDFFIDQHWLKLPQSWQLVLSKVEPQELSVWLNRGIISYKEVWPLSLQSLRVVAHLLALSREPITSNVLLNQFLRQFSDESGQNERNSLSESEIANLDHIFTRHVKPKKQHEIRKLAQVINAVLNNVECHYLVDIGSGQGHLSRLLSLEYGFKVVTIEAVEAHIVSAERYDKQALTEVIKRRNKTQENKWCHNLLLPKHVVLCMSESESGDRLIQTVKNAWKDIITEQNFCFSIIGLHTCGNLAADMLKLFTDTREIYAIVSVGCCYMKLDLNKNYPFSNFLKSISSAALTYEALEIGCHAVEAYIDRLKRNANSLKIHCYRSVLEVLIVKFYPTMKHTGLHSVRHGEKMSFPIYVQNALKRINLTIPDDETISPYVNKCLEDWKLVVIFYSLRLLIAPVIETLVLLDRMLFLYEKGCPSVLIPLFNPALSPRNHILIGIKPKHYLNKNN